METAPAPPSASSFSSSCNFQARCVFRSGPWWRAPTSVRIGLEGGADTGWSSQKQVCCKAFQAGTTVPRGPHLGWCTIPALFFYSVFLKTGQYFHTFKSLLFSQPGIPWSSLVKQSHVFPFKLSSDAILSTKPFSAKSSAFLQPFAYTSILGFISFCFAYYIWLFSYISAYEYKCLEGSKSSNFCILDHSCLKHYVLHRVGA